MTEQDKEIGKGEKGFTERGSQGAVRDGLRAGRPSS